MLRPAITIAEQIASKLALLQGVEMRGVQTGMFGAAARFGAELRPGIGQGLQSRFTSNFAPSRLIEGLETSASPGLINRGAFNSSAPRLVEGLETSATVGSAVPKLSIPHLLIDSHSADRAFPYVSKVPTALDNVQAKIWQKSDGIMQVHTENKVSTGFFIDSELMVTASHGIAPDMKVSSNIMTMLPDGTLHPARLLARAANEDLALLRVSEAGNQVSRFELASATKMQMRDPIYGLGFPGGDEAAFSVGRFRSIDLAKHPGGLSNKQLGWISTEMPAWSGCSGGPMLNRDGKAVGVLVRAFSEENQAFATASEHISTMVDQLVKKGLPERGWIEFESNASLRRGELAIKDVTARLVNG